MCRPNSAQPSVVTFSHVFPSRRHVAISKFPSSLSELRSTPIFSSGRIGNGHFGQLGPTCARHLDVDYLWDLSQHDGLILNGGLEMIGVDMFRARCRVTETFEEDKLIGVIHASRPLTTRSKSRR